MSACVKALGRLKDPKAGLDRLTKLLKNKTIDVVATATEALANYKDAPFETKKTIVDEILKIYGSIAAPRTIRATRRRRRSSTKLQPAADETLRNLTRPAAQGLSRLAEVVERHRQEGDEVVIGRADRS